MPKDNSSASQEQIKPEGKPNSSFITETGKSGALGADPISYSTLKAPGGDTSKTMTSEDFASKGDDSFDGVKEAMPEGKPMSTFINTSAVK